mgnify:CR=1 FL=1
MLTIPKKLRPGDTIRVIAPSSSMGIIAQDTRAIAKERLEKLGLKITFGAHAEEIDETKSSSIASRVADLHKAFIDPEVNGIFAVIGGFNANELLRYIDWGIIRKKSEGIYRIFRYDRTPKCDACESRSCHIFRTRLFHIRPKTSFRLHA